MKTTTAMTIPAMAPPESVVFTLFIGAIVELERGSVEPQLVGLLDGLNTKQSRCRGLQQPAQQMLDRILVCQRNRLPRRAWGARSKKGGLSKTSSLCREDLQVRRHGLAPMLDAAWCLTTVLDILASELSTKDKIRSNNNNCTSLF